MFAIKPQENSGDGGNVKIDYWTIFSGAATLTIALGWHTVIRKAIESYIPKKNEQIAVLIIYAIIISFLVIIIIYIINNVHKRAENFISGIFGTSLPSPPKLF